MGTGTTLTCKDHTSAEAAIHELKCATFDIANLSIVGKDDHTEEHVVGYYNTGDRMKYWGKQGALWGRIWGGSLARRSLPSRASDRSWLRGLSSGGSSVRWKGP